MTLKKTQRAVLERTDFLEALPEDGILLGLDVGSKRIGLAVSTKSRNLAHPRAALMRQGWDADKQAFEQVFSELDVAGIILGHPVTLKGEHGQAVDRVLSFADLLHKAFPDVLMTVWDERLTTVAAERELFTAREGRQTRMSKKDTTAYVDSAAAVLILQGFLDFYQGKIYG